MNRFPLKARLLAVLSLIVFASCAAEGVDEFEPVETGAEAPAPTWKFEVISIYARPNMSPPNLKPAYHSFSVIGLSSVKGAPGSSDLQAVAYFHWGRDAYRNPTLYPSRKLLHLHYPISAFAAVLELLNSGGRVQCFYYDNPLPSHSKAGIEHVVYVSR